MTPASSSDFIRRKHDVSDIPSRRASSDADTLPSDCNTRRMRQSASEIRMVDLSGFCLFPSGFRQSNPHEGLKEAKSATQIDLKSFECPKPWNYTGSGCRGDRSVPAGGKPFRHNGIKSLYGRVGLEAQWVLCRLRGIFVGLRSASDCRADW